MDTIALALGALVGLAIGLGLGYVVRSQLASQSIRAATEKAARIVADANTRQKDLILEAKEEKIRLVREAEEEARERRGELTNMERRLHSRDEQLDQRSDMLEQRDRKLLEKQIELDKGREELDRLNQERIVALERVSGLSVEDAKAQLTEAVREEAERDAVKLARSIERRAREEATEKARDIILTAMQRVAADHTAEHTVTVVHLPNDEMKGRIIGREGRNIRALEQATGVDLIIDDTPETVVLSGFDPVRREVARMALTKLIADGRIHPGRIEEVVNKSRKEVDTQIVETGEQAAYNTGVHGLHPELIKLIGRMKWRTSYGQNILQHSQEVAHLAGIMAAELGLDVAMAKRGALLHDVGKVLTHEHEGTHVQLGVEMATKYGEHPLVVNCIAAHHDDVPHESEVSVLVQAADSISGSRPGARREAFETYVKRLEGLERIASSYKGVERVFAIQAGREIRVVVVPDDVDDVRMTTLSEEIARRIEAELQYPGQIKVVLIRETRAVDFAR